MNLSKGIYVAVFNLVIVGVLGCLLRYIFLNPVSGVNYSYVLHAHSHLAFLGWVFMTLYLLIVYAYLPDITLEKEGKYTMIFMLLQVANIGMLITFPVMGYALWSIIFSALHAFLAMAFAWMIIRDAGLRPTAKHAMSFSWIKWALILMVISNLAPFALGPVSAIQGKEDLYYLLIYFYLHFQYNGWFTFALLGLLLWLLEYHGVNTKVKPVETALKLKLIAIFPAYILSALWTKPDGIWYIIGGLSAATQWVGLLGLIVFVIKNRSVLKLEAHFMLRILFWLGVSAVTLQHVLMFLSAVPELANLAFSRNIVIAYLHMVLLGFVSVLLFLFLLKLSMISLTLSTRIGLVLFLLAFIATECTLVFQGQISEAMQWLFYLALAQLAGILCIAFNAKSIKMGSQSS